jgi:hypothetical protein
MERRFDPSGCTVVSEDDHSWRPIMRTPSIVIAALALAVVLAACGAPTTPPRDTSYTVAGTAHAPPSAPDLLPLGVSVLLIDDDVIGVSAAATSAFIEVEDGYHLGPINPVAADGSFELVFPDGDDVPASTLAPADQFVYNAREIPTCQIDASVASANVTVTGWQFISFPGIVTFFLEGAALSLVTTEPVDLEDPSLEVFDITFATWVYADEAVDVTTGAGCVAAGVETRVDVSLSAGWNQLEWVPSEGEGGDPDVLLLRNSDADQVYVYLGFGI